MPIFKIGFTRSRTIREAASVDVDSATIGGARTAGEAVVEHRAACLNWSQYDSVPLDAPMISGIQLLDSQRSDQKPAAVTRYRRIVRCPVCKVQIDTWEGPDKEPNGMGAAMCLGPSRRDHGEASPVCRIHSDWAQGWIFDDPIEVDVPAEQPQTIGVGQHVVSAYDGYELIDELERLSDRFRGLSCMPSQRVRIENALAVIKECVR